MMTIHPGLQLIDTLIKAHCYWLRRGRYRWFSYGCGQAYGSTGGFSFCLAIREYAEGLGKHNFFLFGELVAGDNAIDRYIGPNTPTQIGDETIYFGLNSVLDFPLYWTLPGAIKGLSSPVNLINRYENLRNHALSRGELGRYLVTFLDNHDQVGQDPKQRFAAGAPDGQVIAG